MGSVNSVSFANIDEGPSANQEQLLREDGEASKTQIKNSKEAKEEDEEESGECGLCQYIKAGECKEAWTELEKCVDITTCKEARIKFKTCMYDNHEYYEFILDKEAEMFADILSDMLQKEKEAILAGDAATIGKALKKVRIEGQDVLPAEAAAISKAFRELEAKKEEKKANGSKDQSV